MPHTVGVTGSLTAIRLENKMFPVTKGRDISGGDEVTTVPKVDSVLSVNGWQYPNRLAQFTRLLSYQHCRLNVNLDTIVSTARNWLMHVFEIKLICLFKKQCWNRVEVEFTGTTNSKCFAPFNKTYLKFFIWAKTDFFPFLQSSTSDYKCESFLTLSCDQVMCVYSVITNHVPVRPGRRWSTEPAWPFCDP